MTRLKKLNKEIRNKVFHRWTDGPAEETVANIKKKKCYFMRKNKNVVVGSASLF